MRPSRMSSSRVQREASSMTWLEMRNVTGSSPPASRWNNSHNSARSTGSSPTVGSSSTSTFGVPSNAAASDTRARCPPESRSTRAPSLPANPTAAITRSGSSRGAPSTAAKYRRFSITDRSP